MTGPQPTPTAPTPAAPVPAPATPATPGSAPAVPVPATAPPTSAPETGSDAGQGLSARWRAALMDNYGTPSTALVKGEGATVWDDRGNQYVDMYAGIAVNVLGHAHPAIVEAVSAQIATLGHVSNLFASVPAVTLAERLLGLSGRDGRVYFCNSGAEANEAAFKLSRRTGRTHIVAAQGGFHGRTMGALALTGQPSKQDPFRPLPGDVTHVPFGDVEALTAAVTDETALVILEPTLGEAGVVPAPPGYLAAAREVTTAKGALLALDEVQTGIGRTGYWFAHQAEGIQPDVVTLAKGLGGGLPLGACLAFGEAASLFGPGSHGSTFGGNPVSCAAALAVLDTIVADDLLARAKHLGERLRNGIEGLAGVAEVRGSGALLGVVLTDEVAKSAEAALAEAGFLVNAVAPGVLRLAPPLVLTDVQADAFLAALPAALEAATTATPAPRTTATPAATPGSPTTATPAPPTTATPEPAGAAAPESAEAAATPAPPASTDSTTTGSPR